MARKVDLDELIDATEVSELLGLSSRNATSVYRHRYPEFPAPVIERGTCVLWLRADIVAWSAGRGR